ncbi:MAG: HAMP domain-containing protein [Alphaproteobacteria bacterium]|nr:HAMP domain-containing protein [Alphaproteobacteria bacterium]
MIGRALRRLLPRSLGTQIALSTVALLAVVQACSVAILVLTRPPPPPIFDPDWLSQRLAALAVSVGGVEPGDRMAWLEAQPEAHWLEFSVSGARPPAPPGGRTEPRLRRFEADIRAAAGNRVGTISVALDPPPPGAPAFGPPRIETVPGPTAALAHAEELRPVRFFVADLQLADESWLRIQPHRAGRLVPELKLAATWLVLFLAAAVIAALWAVRRLSAPLATIAHAAEAFGRGSDAAPLDVGGAREIEAIAGAFAAMRERVLRFVHDRTTMLAAISHDLRTPLTRMRMRVERVADEALRDALKRDLDALEAIVVETLDFARVESGSARRDRIDLASLLDTIVDARIDALQDVRLATCERVALSANGAAVRRIVENLVDNALKYGGAAEVALVVRGGEAVVTVADRGPGIPDGDLEAVFRPFHRLETSRSRETGGTGLGLAIARTLARAHGGDVRLAARPGGGLIATLALPLPRDPEASSIL